MPVSSIVHWSANSAEKLTLPPARLISLPSWRRSLSLAVIDTTRAPWRENSAMIVRERSNSGPVMTTALARGGIEIEVAGDPVHGRAGCPW